MPKIDYEGITINVDDEGYLANMDEWNEKVACALADREGVSKKCPLTKERMEILKFMRDYYKHYSAFPILRAVCKAVHQPKECTQEEFPNPIEAWKIAGLPKPNPEVLIHLEYKRKK
jgi:TusE/DsrC/DsvC family sulfur relay protein